MMMAGYPVTPEVGRLVGRVHRGIPSTILLKGTERTNNRHTARREGILRQERLFGKERKYPN